MTRAEIETGGQTIEVDFSDLEKRLEDNVATKMRRYVENLKTWKKDEPHGKGVVERFSDEKKNVILEEFKKGKLMNAAKIKEQWTIAIPSWATKELAGHLRDYVWVTDVVKGKPGETVNIPYVKDLDFAFVTVKTGTFTATTGLINVLTTTLYEAGAYYDAYYGDIEKIDANMLDELNRVFAHAAIRAEDKRLIHDLDACTTADLTSPGGTTRTTFGEGTTGMVAGNGVILGNTLSDFSYKWIAKGLAKLMKRGKDVRPGECILIIGANAYLALLTELAASTSTLIGYNKGEIITRGMIEDFLGVKIVVVSHTGSFSTPAGSTNSFECSYLIRPKRTLALAPKRDILIETDKLIENRQLRIAASHTFGTVVIDKSEIVRFVDKNET